MMEPLTGTYTITPTTIAKAEQILIDNGIVDKEEAMAVLQAIGYALLDIELYPHI